MQVIINGDPRELEPGMTVAGVLRAVGLDLRSVVVEHNGAIVAPADYGSKAVNEGDIIEIVRMVGGG